MVRNAEPRNCRHGCRIHYTHQDLHDSRNWRKIIIHVSLLNQERSQHSNKSALTKIVRSSWSDTRVDLDGVAGALGGGSDERPDAEVLHVPLGEPAVVFAELRRGVLAAVDAGHERPAR